MATIATISPVKTIIGIQLQMTIHFDRRGTDLKSVVQPRDGIFAIDVRRRKAGHQIDRHKS